MTKAEVSQAVGQSEVAEILFRASLPIVLPVLYRIRDGASWWLRWGMNQLIEALEAYAAEPV